MNTPDLIPWETFCAMHNVPASMVKHDINLRVLSTTVDGALNKEQQKDFHIIYCLRLDFKPCPDCPHERKRM